MEDESWIDTARTLFEPAPQSVAETLLAKVFGNWVFSENAERGVAEGPLVFGNFMGMDEVALLTTILGFSGILAAAFGLIISSYTFLMQMVKNAWTGSFAADGINSIFWPARTVAALALIIPVVSIGSGDRQTQVATSQLMMMEIAKAGSAFGDSVSTAYVRNAFSFPLNNTRPPETPIAVFNVFKIASCSIIAAEKEGEDRPEHAQIVTAVKRDGTTVSYIPSKYVDNDGVNKLQSSVNVLNDGRKNFVATNSVESAISSAFSQENVSSLVFGNNGICGSISFRTASAPVDSGGRGESTRDLLELAQSRAVAAYKEPYRALTLKLFTEVETIVDTGRLEEIIEEEHGSDAAGSPEAKFLFELIAAFNTQLYTSVADSINGIQDQLGGSMFEPVIDGGWAALGALYSVIPRVSNIAMSNITDAQGIVSASESKFPCFEEYFGLSENCEAQSFMDAFSGIVLTQTKQYRASFQGETPTIGVLDYCSIDQCNLMDARKSFASTYSQTILRSMAGAGNYLSTAGGQGGTNAVGVSGDEMNRPGVSAGFLQGRGEDGFTDAINDDWRDWRESRDPNPINTISSIGTSLIGLGALYQSITAPLELAASASDAASNSAANPLTSPLAIAAAVLAKSIKMVVGFLETASLMMIAGGFYLSYILPMIPFIIFTMQVVGWLATTIEGMFAVSFAVALLTNSDGDGAINTGFLKAVSLTAAIFLKPFFIVVGVATANAIAAPSFAYFNVQYWRAWDVDNQLGGSLSNPVFEMSAQLILYMLAATILIRFIYSVQHIIPDSMNNWVAGGIVNPFGVGDAADQVNSNVREGSTRLTSTAIEAAAPKDRRR